MITEDQLEQLAIQWFQDTGWNHAHGAVIAPEGVAAEREDRENIEHRTLNIWLTQKMMAALYNVSVPAINQHLKRILSDNELEEEAVVKPYLITAADGKNYHSNVEGKRKNSLRREKVKWARPAVGPYRDTPGFPAFLSS